MSSWKLVGKKGNALNSTTRSFWAGTWPAFCRKSNNVGMYNVYVMHVMHTLVIFSSNLNQLFEQLSTPIVTCSSESQTSTCFIIPCYLIPSEIKILSVSFSYVFVLQLLCKGFFVALVFFWQCFIQSMTSSQKLVEWLFSYHSNTGHVRVSIHFSLVSKYWCCIKVDVHFYFLQ